MKKPFITDILLVISLSILCVASFTLSELVNENREMKKQLKQQTNTVNQLEDEVDALENIMEDRESEISYWGMKYDSIKELR